MARLARSDVRVRLRRPSAPIKAATSARYSIVAALARLGAASPASCTRLRVGLYRLGVRRRPAEGVRLVGRRLVAGRAVAVRQRLAVPAAPAVRPAQTEPVLLLGRSRPLYHAAAVVAYTADAARAVALLGPRPP